MLDSVKDSFLRYCYWVGDTLKRLFCIVSVSAFSIFLAVSMYGGLYWAILPSTASSFKIKWDFTSCEVVGQPCSFIRSEVVLSKQLMLVGSRYNLELLLDVPDCPANREVGMFLACSTLLPSNISTCSSAMIPYRSLIVSSLEDVILLPLHIARVLSSTSVLSIPLLDNYTESAISRTSSIKLELQTSKLQFSSSRLKVWPHDLSGVRYLMYHHPLLSTVLGVTTILAVICLTVALAIARFLQPHRVVVAPRVRSNHDLADRQARAKLNQEYRQARLKEIKSQEVEKSEVDKQAAEVLLDPKSSTATSVTSDSSLVSSVISSKSMQSIYDTKTLLHSKLE